MKGTILLAIVVSAGCAPGGGGETSSASATVGTAESGLDLGSARLLDLSYTYDDDTIYWPTSPSGFELTELARGKTDGGYFYSSYSFCTPEHGGTHLDAPVHFSETGETPAEIPVRRLVAPGIVIDMAEQASKNPDALLGIDTVKGWEARNGPVPQGAIVVLRTGWGPRWSEGARSYLGDDTPGDASKLHFPGYGEEAARYLVEERQVGGLGIDTASVDYGQSKNFIVHQIAAAHNVFNLENVARAEELPPKGFWLIALPIKSEHGSGGPVRIVAMLPPG
jgi:kynurenine formamidase